MPPYKIRWMVVIHVNGASILSALVKMLNANLGSKKKVANFEESCRIVFPNGH